jgi:hypothetical protein
MVKLKISRFKTKDIITGKGPAKVHNFQASGEWYSSFAGSWNAHWKDGIEIELDEKQIAKVEKNGKTFRNIYRATKGTGNAGFEQRVLKALGMIWKDVQEIKKHLAIKP